MNHGSLFSGIGGFDYAADQMGWNNVFHCEIEPFPRKVLKYYWPNAISYEDIRETDFTIHRGKIDILSGGFPCQPYSVAGNRKGKEDDRHLWPEMLRAIRELAPSWIVGENVPGIISWNEGLVFEEVCTDLENEGYEVQPIVLPAASVNAPHKRDRVWFVAKDASYSTSYGSHDESSEENIKNRQNNKQSRKRWIGATKGLSDEQYATNAKRTGLERENRERMGKPTQFAEQTTSNSDSIKRPKGRCDTERSTSTKRHVGLCNSWADGGAWQDFPTQPPVCSGDDGLPSDSYRETISRKHNMDRDLVIKSALDAGRLEVDFDSGKIYSRTIKGMKGERVELKGADCNGYRVHNIYFEGFKKQCRAHQIVWIAANGLYDKSKLMIDHINRDKSDNRLSNLRLTTPKGNRMNAPDPKSRFSQNEKDLMHELHTIGHMSFREISEHFECSKSRVHQIVSEHNGIYGITFSKWRNESIKAYGNAVVPQVVMQIFRVIEKMNAE